MREQGTGTKLLSIGGSAAELFEKCKQAAAVAASVLFFANAALAFALDHMFWAIGSIVCLVLTSAAAALYLVMSKASLVRACAVAETFRQLENSREEFEGTLAGFRGEPSRKNLARLMASHAVYLEKICMTAKTTFTVMKPHKGPFEANLKRIVLKPDARGVFVAHYSPMATTYAVEEERKKYDDAIRGNLPKVSANYWYSKMFKRRFRTNTTSMPTRGFSCGSWTATSTWSRMRRLQHSFAL
jgi:hypothetical protein